MLESIPYALAMVAAVVAFWDAHRRRTLVMGEQLTVCLQFEAMKRDFELLTVQTKKAIEVQHTQVNDALHAIQARLAVEDMKRENDANAFRRIG